MVLYILVFGHLVHFDYVRTHLTGQTTITFHEHLTSDSSHPSYSGFCLDKTSTKERAISRVPVFFLP